MTEKPTDNVNDNFKSDSENDDKNNHNEEIISEIPKNTDIHNDVSQESLEADSVDISSNTEARLEQLEKEYENLKSQNMRLAADFDNFRKRQSRDQDDLKTQLICKALTSILPIVDNFERARQQLKPESEEAQSLHRSYQGLYKQLVDVLKQQGVAPMRVVGQPFDPNLHEAVLREPSQDQNEDIIIEELQRGYHMDGKVLRHALVKVSMGPGKTTNSQDQLEKDIVVEDSNSDEKLSDEEE